MSGVNEMGEAPIIAIACTEAVNIVSAGIIKTLQIAFIIVSRSWKFQEVRHLARLPLFQLSVPAHRDEKQSLQRVLHRTVQVSGQLMETIGKA